MINILFEPNAEEQLLIDRFVSIIEARRQRLNRAMSLIQIKINSLCLEIFVENSDDVEDRWVSACENYSCNLNWK